MLCGKGFGEIYLSLSGRNPCISRRLLVSITKNCSMNWLKVYGLRETGWSCTIWYLFPETKYYRKPKTTKLLRSFIFSLIKPSKISRTKILSETSFAISKVTTTNSQIIFAKKSSCILNSINFCTNTIQLDSTGWILNISWLSMTLLSFKYFLNLKKSERAVSYET